MAEWEEKSKAEIIFILYSEFLEKHKDELIKEGKEWSRDKDFMQYKENNAILHQLTLGEGIAGIDEEMNVSLSISSSIGELDVAFRITPAQIVDLIQELPEIEQNEILEKLIRQFLQE